MENIYNLPEDLHKKLENIPNDARIIEVGTSEGPYEGTTGYLFHRLQNGKLKSLLTVDLEIKSKWNGFKGYPNFHHYGGIDILTHSRGDLIAGVFNKEQGNIVVFGVSEGFIEKNGELAKGLAKRVVDLSGVQNLITIIYPENLV